MPRTPATDPAALPRTTPHEGGPGRARAGDVALRVDGLVKRYAGTAVVDGLSLVARRGAITAVLGPNGAGKTTTVECCEGLRAPDAGTVEVLGLDPLADAAALRPRVGVMLQDGGLPTGTRPVRLLRHLARLYAAPADRDALVTRLGIADFDRTTVRRLSGGQRQRVALAAALIGRPHVALLDEPTAGLDPHARLDVWDLVRETRDAGCAVVVTTHSFVEAERLADQVVIVGSGRVVGAGPLAELTRHRSLEDLYFGLTREHGR